MRYDAFISYRHGELDGLVAEKLHKMLETYRIPAAIAKKTGKKRIKRVFRDREELPTSSNLSGSINEALENSEYLLLICSPRLLESQWCMREVEIFGQLHGKDKIISLLIDGEPHQAFPPDIRFREIEGQTVEVEPLAADIRAATWRDSLKLLKSEKLRLLAPILGCAYDDLRQRHRTRQRQLLAAILGAVLAVSLGFGSFSTFQYLQIQRQMQLKLENQSHVLAGYSQEALANGYPEIATLLALEALPRSLEQPQRPYVKAAERALANALGVYDMTDGFRPHKTVSLPAAPGGITLSPGERYAAVCYAFGVTVFEPETGRVAATLPTVQSVLAGAAFVSDDVLIYAGAEGLTAYDIDRGQVLWVGEMATGITISGDRTRIAAVYRDSGEARLYTAQGQWAGTVSFGGRHCPVPADDTFLNPRDFVLALNDDGSRLAVSFADGALSLFRTAGAMEETPLFPPSGAIYFNGGFGGSYFAFAVVENQPYAAHYQVYDLQNEAFTLALSSQTSRFVAFADAQGLLFAHENQIYTVTGATGEMEHLASVGEWIEALQRGGDTLLICDSAGGYHFIGGSVKVYTSDYVCEFAAIGARFALTGSYDSDTVRVLQKQEHSASNLLTYALDEGFSEARVNSGAGQVLLYSYKGLACYSLEGTLLGTASFPDPQLVVDTQYDKVTGNLAVIYPEALRVYSGEDGRLLMEKRGAAGKQSVIYTPFGVHILEADGQVLLVDPATAAVAGQSRVPRQAQFALLVGRPLYGLNGQVFYDDVPVGQGSYIGGVRQGEGSYAFAIAESESGLVFTIGAEGLTQAFSFQIRGKAEAFFSGGFVFIAELRGTATAYRMDGAVARTFSEEGYIAQTEAMGDDILMHLISGSSGRYSLLLDGKTLEAGAHLPGLLDWQADGTLIFNDGNGHLRTGHLYSAGELMEAARAALDGRVLTDSERIQYRAQ